MRRFFVDSEYISDDTVAINSRDARHIARVLRLRPGDCIQVVDSAGRELEVELEHVSDTRAAGTIRSVTERVSTIPGVSITLVQGIPKGDKMDFIVQKCTELGVTRFMPVTTSRSVSKPDEKSCGRKGERWRRIAAEAAKQCGTGKSPEVCDVVSLQHALAVLVDEGTTILLPWELETDRSLRAAFDGGLAHCDGRLAMVVGPEGGFSQDEVEFAVELGVVTVSLGKRILRTETAGMAVAAVLMYELGELG